MLRSNDTLRLVMIDFGLSVGKNFVAVNVEPTGSQTHWSPEKAAAEGYDFGADLWAAVTVFVHMLSGSEPWLERYKEARHLHYIVSKCVSLHAWLYSRALEYIYYCEALKCCMWVR